MKGPPLPPAARGLPVRGWAGRSNSAAMKRPRAPGLRGRGRLIAPRRALACLCYMAQCHVCVDRHDPPAPRVLEFTQPVVPLKHILGYQPG